MFIAAWTAVAIAMGNQTSAADVKLDDRGHLEALEVRSHQHWFDRDLTGLSQIMDEDFRFVVMNGALETRNDVVGPRATGKPPSPLSVRSMAVQPDEVIVRDNTGIVISTMQIDATVSGQPLPALMRVLSVFTRQGSDWMLISRSITPIRERQPRP